MARIGLPISQRLPQFNSFWEFYAFFLGEHNNPINRRLHFLGTVVFVTLAGAMIALGRPLWAPLALLLGLSIAWIGHAIFEHNKPKVAWAPILNLAADMIMCFQMLTGKIPF